MPRPPRILIAGGIYHVYTRGVVQDPVFLDDRDRSRFLRLLSLTVAKYGIEIRAFCLMANHVHLQVRTPHPNLSAAMQYLFGLYATGFNRRHERTGHLFESRYLSPLVEPGWFEVRLSRYIHRNPLKPGLAAHPAEYPWSSYRYFLYPGECPGWLSPGSILELLSRIGDEAIRLYMDFVERGDEDGGPAAMAFERRLAIGSECFRDRFPDPEATTMTGSEAYSIGERVGGQRLEGILRLVARSFGIEPVDCFPGEWDRREALAAAAWILVNARVGTQVRVGELLGGRSRRTIVRYLQEARAHYRKDEGFRARVESCLRSARKERDG